MSRYLIRRWLVGIVGLSLTLVATGLQAQSKGQTENDSKTKEAAETIARLQKDLDTKQKQLSDMREYVEKMQADLQPIRQKKQYEEDLQRLRANPRFAHQKPGPAEARIYAELDKPTVLEFIETPLADVIEYLKDYHNIEIQLDQRALDDAGIGSDAPITRSMRGISLRSALELLFRELDLVWTIYNEVLLITTDEAAKVRFKTRTYDVRTLLTDEQSSSQLAEVIRQLLSTSQRDRAQADPPVSSATVVTAYRNLLIVRTNHQGHNEMDQLLSQLTEALASTENATHRSGSAAESPLR